MGERMREEEEEWMKRKEKGEEGTAGEPKRDFGYAGSMRHQGSNTAVY